jgi:hypothetical protein
VYFDRVRENGGFEEEGEDEVQGFMSLLLHQCAYVESSNTGFQLLRPTISNFGGRGGGPLSDASASHQSQDLSG